MELPNLGLLDVKIDAKGTVSNPAGSEALVAVMDAREALKAAQTVYDAASKSLEAARVAFNAAQAALVAQGGRS